MSICRRLVLSALGVMVLLTQGCLEGDETLVDGNVGQSAEALSFLTSTEKMPATTYSTRYQFTGGGLYVAAAAAYDTSAAAPDAYVLMTRDVGSPYALRLHRIVATPGDPLFGKKATTLPTSCVGGLPCGSEAGIWDSASLRSSANVDYALFGYGSKVENVMMGTTGASAARVMRVSHSLAHSDFVVHECRAQLGNLLLCRVQGPALSSSTRADGTDKALVSYLLEPDPAVNDWQIAAKLMSPNGTMVALPSVGACPSPPCKTGFIYPFIESAYNKLANKFLAVTLTYDPGVNQTAMRGQIYDGTTGALGATVDFGVFPQRFFQLGVASSTHPLFNQDSEWVVQTNTALGYGGTYHVRPDGTFDTVTPSTASPQPVGLWTLQWNNAGSEKTHYEFFHDTSIPPSSAFLTRYKHNLTGTATFDVASSQAAFVESLAFGRGTSDIAVWSGYDCTTGGAGSVCGAHILWRFLSRS